jgi:hypothetical protein
MTKTLSGQEVDILNNNFSGKFEDHAKDYYKDYFCILELDENGYTIEKWKVYNPILTDLKTDKLDYSNSNILTITCTIAYDWAELQPGDPQDAINKIKLDKYIKKDREKQEKEKKIQQKNYEMLQKAIEQFHAEKEEFLSEEQKRKSINDSGNLNKKNPIPEGAGTQLKTNINKIIETDLDRIGLRTIEQPSLKQPYYGSKKPDSIVKSFEQQLEDNRPNIRKKLPDPLK